MDKLEYGDFYKFVVSLGITLIAISLLAPWMVLREPFDLLLETNKIHTLTPTAQQIVFQRQEMLAVFFPWIKWCSVSCMVLGSVTVIVGLRRWWKRQEVHDNSEDLSLEKQRNELKAMSEVQLNDRASAASDLQSSPPTNTLEAQTSVANFLRVEKLLQQRIKSCLSDSYQLLTNQVLGNAEFDAILQSNRSDQSDVVIEIKYIRQGFRYGWLRETVEKLATAQDLYRSRLKRKALPLLIVIFASDSAPASLEFEQLKLRAERQLVQRGIDLRIEFVRESAIANLECKELNRLIFG